MPKTLAIFYIVECVLCLIVGLQIYYFSGYLPREFSKLGRICNCFGALMKLFPKVINLMHGIILILIVVAIAKTAGNGCEQSSHVDSATGAIIINNQMHNDAIIMIIIVSALWILMHLGGAVIRSLL